MRASQDNSSEATSLPLSLFKNMADQSFLGHVIYKPVYQGKKIVDLETVYMNPKAASLLNSSAGQVVGKTILQLFPGSKEQGIFDAYVKTFETGKGFEKELYYPFDGLDNWYKLNCSRVDDMLLLIYEDITEAQKRAAALKESQMRLRSIFDNTYQFTGILQPDGIVIEANKSSLDFAGISLDDIKGERFWNTHWWQISAEAQDKLKKAVERAAQGESVQFEAEIWDKQRRPEVIDFAIKPVFDDEGRVVLLLPEARVITEMKNAQNALAESERRFRKIFENAGLGIAIVDAAGQPVITNQYFQNMIGYSADELAKMTFAQFTHPEDADKDMRYYEQLMNGDIDYYQMEKRYICKNGDIMWGNLTVSIVQDREGKPLYGIGMVQDINRRKQYENELKAMNEELDQRVKERTVELENVNKDLESFTYTVSHDLRGPIRAMIGYAQLIHDKNYDNLNEEGREFFQLVISTAKHMGELLEDLLKFSRLGQSKIKQEEVDVREIVTELSKYFSDLLLDNPVTFDVQHDLPTIKADKRLIRQVFYNLISNGIKFSADEREPLITIGAKYDTNHGAPVFYVADNGIGFDQKYAEQIFQVFNRLHRDDEYEGTGIGLAIVHRVIEKHGGTIWAKGEKGKGATFYFQLQ